MSFLIIRDVSKREKHRTTAQQDSKARGDHRGALGLKETHLPSLFKQLFKRFPFLTVLILGGDDLFGPLWGLHDASLQTRALSALKMPPPAHTANSP